MERTLTINGVKFAPSMIGELLINITDPDPTKWFNYRRDGENIIVEAITAQPWPPQSVTPQTPPTGGGGTWPPPKP